MPQVRFEPTIPVFERANTVRTLNHGHCNRLYNYITHLINAILLGY
jgi:hypothetical protein